MSDLKIKLFSILNSIGPSMSAQQSEDISDAFKELAALKEQNALLTVQVQEGWKLVPVEPTEEMLFAAETSHVRGYRDLYSVMIAAAPDLPQQVKSEDARDAARYRWLKAQSDGRPFYFHGIGHKYPENLDAAIDAAIAAQGSKG